MTTPQSEVIEQARELRGYATHFPPRDWAYTRDTGDLHAVLYEPAYRSALRAAGRFFARHHNRGPLAEEFRVSRWAIARAVWRRRRSMPDGVLDGGSVITFWEETGEYLQKVQPSVGALLADLMEAHPGLPEVQAVAVEMKRIADDYQARLTAAARNGQP